MNAIDRSAAEFRALQAQILDRFTGLDLTFLGDLAIALSIQKFRCLELYRGCTRSNQLAGDAQWRRTR